MNEFCFKVIKISSPWMKKSRVKSLSESRVTCGWIESLESQRNLWNLSKIYIFFKSNTFISNRRPLTLPSKICSAYKNLCIIRISWISIRIFGILWKYLSHIIGISSIFRIPLESFPKLTIWGISCRKTELELLISASIFQNILTMKYLKEQPKKNYQKPGFGNFRPLKKCYPPFFLPEKTLRPPFFLQKNGCAPFF